MTSLFRLSVSCDLSDSPQVDTAYSLGDDAKARQKSQQALGLSIAAIGFGVVIHLSWIGAVVYFVVIVGNALHSTST